MSEWKGYRFSDFVTVNPSVKILEKEAVSFVEMKDLTDGKRYCEPSQLRNLSGGSKFENGDTLFARITPCLENGKICQVRNLKNEVGFGSTEFHVLRGKENTSDTDFVFYLSRWKEVRDHAELNFDGTSGRQRVPKQAFDDLILNLPPLSEQKSIASILSSLDDKIDLLQRQNATLEAMAETLFRQWFVEEAKEESSTQLLLGDLIESVSITHKLKSTEIVFLNTSDIYLGDVLVHEYTSIKNLPGQAKKSIQKDDILFSEIRPANGRWAYIDFDADDYVVSTKLMVLRSKKRISQAFIYFYLTNKQTVEWLQMLAESRSGTFPQITFDQLRDLKINVPSTEKLTEVSVFCEDAIRKIKSNNKQIRTLTTLRDVLLPKLMSGEVRVGV
jgi:type I restriction enzyme, S subunit